MASTNEMYAGDSNWLKCEDLSGKEHKVAISGIEVKKVEQDDKKLNKLELAFTGQQKALLLNKTNASVVAKAYGDDYTTWLGKEIIMYPTVTDFGGKTVDCIRLRVPLEMADTESSL
jgi:hypothetical protein